MYFWPLIFRQKAPLPACNLSYIVARRFGKFRVIVNIADNRKAAAVSAQVIQKLHCVNGKIPSAATLKPSLVSSISTTSCAQALSAVCFLATGTLNRT